ncbi:acetyl-CoA carboxylase-like isoform X1 [Pimephales promelas]|uniref:acetyl-CoA carboxylase-like isoform X1 n=2 Tax=Pimephales promelas TaxID=90988 RepID=UPI001955F4E8|nr:acetyl-CoA carboxylase-like isoform X1 [Pimephales promelas]
MTLLILDGFIKNQQRLWLANLRRSEGRSVCDVLAACQRGLPMAEQDSTEKKLPAVAALHTHFIVGSVSEDNSEDETAGKLDLQMEDNPRSLSPSSVSSDSTYEMGFDSLDGALLNIRDDDVDRKFKEEWTKK